MADVSDQIVSAESGGDPNAKNPNSSASGSGQFLDGTWLDTIKSARPDLAQGKSDADLLALKTDPDLSRQMTQAYAQQNGAILSKAGLPVTPGSTYLAHFAGPGGAVGLLNADPSTPASAILGPSVVKANPFLASMTAGDVAAWANRKMGGQPAPMSMAGPSPQAAAPAAPVSLAPAAAAAKPQTTLAWGGQPAAPAAAAPAPPAAPNGFFNILPQRKLYPQPAPFSLRG